jgi:hypothetical protein
MVTAVLHRIRKWRAVQMLGRDRGRPVPGARARLRKLDVGPNPERVREYVACLGEGLRSEAGEWKKMEQVMIQAAIKTLSKLPDPMEDTWLTTEANSELRQLYKTQSGFRRMLRHNMGEETLHKIKLERKAVRRAIRQCVKRHKDRFRMRLAEAVAKLVDQLKAQIAFTGNSLTRAMTWAELTRRM